MNVCGPNEILLLSGEFIPSLEYAGAKPLYNPINPSAAMV